MKTDTAVSATMPSHPERMTPHVFVVDDDISVRESLESLIRCMGWTVECFESARDFLDRPRSAEPSCLLLDVNLPDLNGLLLQKQIAGERMDMPIIFLTGCGDVPMTVRAMKAGAFEFLTKPFDEEVLLEAIRQAIERSDAVLGDARQLRTLRDSYASLSRREAEVMRWVVTGLLNKQIAGELDISEITVKAHRGSVMRKMKAGSLANLVNMAAKLELRLPSRSSPTFGASAPQACVWPGMANENVAPSVSPGAPQRRPP
jgi:FixJ family two-component response regulator